MTVESQLRPFLFQRARRQLPVTVKSDSGLAEGEIWFVEGCELTFWCVEKLESAARYELRADIKTTGRNVDLVVEVVEVMHGRDAAAPGGFLHRGDFICIDAADEQRLARRFWQLNPEVAPPDADLDAQSGTHGAARVEAPRRPARSTQREHAPRSTRPRDQASKDRSATRSRGSREQSGRPPTHGERRRLREKGRTGGGVPEPPLAREHRVAVEVAPGDPPSVMVSYAHREVMQADVLLQGDSLWLFVGGHPLLWDGQEISLYVQLPAGHMVQLRARVVSARKDYCVIESLRLHASMVANFRVALGG